MELSHERIQEMKDLLGKEKGREFTWEEASEAAYGLAGYAQIVYGFVMEDGRRKKKLEEFPDGYKLDGIGYTCSICKNGTHQNENWYDKWGIKCTLCQKAIDRKEIPASLAKNEDDWYSDYDIKSSFNVDRHVLKRWVKEGVLKARTVSNDGKGIHVQLFLIKDNKDTLPPKKMLKSQMVKETKDGKDSYHLEPWYKFVDPVKHLKGYKIMNHLKVTHGEQKV